MPSCLRVPNGSGTLSVSVSIGSLTNVFRAPVVKSLDQKFALHTVSGSDDVDEEDEDGGRES